ncbi:wax ester/triacylglycerol synthase domain-containing protein [Streptomyces aidingensis]|uniref:Wax ester synthase-like Acyl-CoA acyltransferase domain-containing protein n=1 Tax=Streptomyces aidingensis TaxID=910347 RepID=A0A1I1SKM2_9ACTN|nr:wax ester/triacylglycerol synthase domain-containing protein [Streptomyces aidingensis]SFD47024.1 Wax ester synthase-like Acyl-CoA acyltransferase domain-containing protein [Streptomyces aidingensis]
MPDPRCAQHDAPYSSPLPENTGPDGCPVGPVDRFFRELAGRHQPTTGFFADFHGPAPDAGRLAADVLRRARALPALNVLLTGPGRPRWRAPEAELDPAVHLRIRTGLTGPAELTAVSEGLLGHPLPDGGHPPWDLWLLTGHAPDAFRLCFRVHHMVQDGVGAAYSLLALLGRPGDEGPRLHPDRPATVRGAVRTGGWLLRSLLPPRTVPLPPPLAAPRSADGPGPGPARMLRHAEVAEHHLRRAADAWGMTVNDVCLAGLAAALDIRTDIPVLLAMSTRRPDERYAPGNRVVGHPMMLPCSAPDPWAAARRIGRATEAARRARTRHTLRRTLERAPEPVGRWVLGSLARSCPVGVSSVTLPAPAGYGGARLTGASMVYHPHPTLLPDEPSSVYVSFTRTPGTVRCTLIGDPSPAAAVIPARWSARLLAAAGG